MITIGRTVDLAEEIIDDTCLVMNILTQATAPLTHHLQELVMSVWKEKTRIGAGQKTNQNLIANPHTPKDECLSWEQKAKRTGQKNWVWNNNIIIS